MDRAAQMMERPVEAGELADADYSGGPKATVVK